MPTISIIVPVYNVEEYLPRCIESILNQTFKDIELILVNDGSTDRSGEICDQFEKKDRRIKVIHKKNGGLSDARNKGLDVSTGTYVGFVDSDDYIEEDMYEKLYNACILYDVRISMSGRYDVYPTKKREEVFTLKEMQLWSSKEAILKILMWKDIDSSACDKLFERTLFNKIRFPYGKYNEDIYIIPEIIHDSGEIVHIGEPKYNYYHRADSITTESFSESKMNLLDAIKNVELLVLENYPELEKEYSFFYFQNIIYLNSIVQPKDIKKEYNEAYCKLYKLLSINIYEILLNKRITIKNKIKSILIFLKVYNFFEQLNSLLRSPK